MVVDLLSRIEQELYERMEELYPVLEECEQLQADLSALEVVPEPLVEPEQPAALDIDRESFAGFESPATAEVAPEPPYEPEPSTAQDADCDKSAAVLSFPANRKAVRTAALAPKAVRPISTLSRPASVPASAPANEPVVSPKVARLMLTPRRPALERSGIARVGAGV
jgi:hypothetical protein